MANDVFSVTRLWVSHLTKMWMCRTTCHPNVLAWPLLPALPCEWARLAHFCPLTVVILLALLCLTLLKTQPAASSLWGVSWFISRGLPTRSHFLCCPCTHGISSHPQVRDASFSSPHSRCQFALQLINTKLSSDEINTISSSGMQSSNKVLGNTENYNTLSYRVVTVEGHCLSPSAPSSSWRRGQHGASTGWQ